MRMILLIILSLPMSLSYAEKILNKKDTEYIFSLNRDGWESYVNKMVYPAGWKAKTLPLETGTSVMAFDFSTGYGLSILPVYFDKINPPSTLTIGSYYPTGVLPEVTEQYLDKVKKATEHDLGTKYAVFVREAKPPLIGIEITVGKN